MPSSAQIQRARALRRTLSPPEARLWRFLKTLRPNGYHICRQAPFGPYILDFVCYDHKLVIEVDGAHHATPNQQTHDQIRDSTLAALGFRTLRIPATDVLNNLEGVTT